MENNKFHNDISRELGGVNQRLEGIEGNVSTLVVEVKKTNGKVKKIIIALTLIGGIIIGQIMSFEEIIKILIGKLL